jgi:hypothetical protein
MMQREQQIPATPSHGSSSQDNDSHDFGELEQIRARIDGISEAADRILAAYTPIQAEQFLQQNRQSSAQ